MMPNTTDNPAMGPGSAGYGWAKRILISYTEQMALHLAPKFIRVNAIHPTNCNTHLLHNDGLYSVFRPDLEHPTREEVGLEIVGDDGKKAYDPRVVLVLDYWGLIPRRR